MQGQTRLLTQLARLIKPATADGVTATAHALDRQVVRFAHGALHQSVRQALIRVTVRVVHNRRVGVACADTLNPDGLARCLAAAEDIARHSPAQPEVPQLPRGVRLRSREQYAAATLALPPDRVAARVKRLTHLCQGVGASLAGSMLWGADEFAVVNSAGVSAYAIRSVASAKLVTMYRRLSGYATETANAFEGLQLDALLQRSLSQCLHRKERVNVPLGRYEVVLEPEAVADLVEWLGWIAFGAKAMQERTSPLAGRMGDRLMDEQITIYDDGTEPGTLCLPFDFEGTPKGRTMLIDRGVASGIVYDTTYGLRFGAASTGHAMPAEEDEGPMPLHLAILPGDATAEGMVKSCERGLWIPRFHYVNGLLNPAEALMTGLTREGAFLIEAGRLTTPVATLRFTQGLLAALSRVRAVSRQRRLIADPSAGLGAMLMPSLHLASFEFTGRSER